MMVVEGGNVLPYVKGSRGVVREGSFGAPCGLSPDVEAAVFGVVLRCVSTL